MAEEYFTKKQTIELLEKLTDVILKTFKDHKAWVKDLETRLAALESGDDVTADFIEGEVRAALKNERGPK